MDADQLIRRPVLPWELGAERGHPVSANYGYLKGCDNSFGELHMNNATYCDKVSSSSFPPLSLLFPFSFPPLSLLFPSSFPALSLLFPSSFPSLSLLFPSSFPPLSLLFPFSFPPLSLVLPSSFPPLSLLLPSSFPHLSLLLPSSFPPPSLLFPSSSLSFSPLPTPNHAHTHSRSPTFLSLSHNPATHPRTGVGGYIVIHVEDLRRLAPIWSAKSEEVRADVEHYTINATGDVHGQRWISEMYGYSFGSSDVGLKHIMIDSAMLYPGYDPPKGVDPRMIHYGLELKVLDWQWDKSAYYRQDMVNTCGQHFPDPPEISALPGNQTYEERRRDFIVIECMAVLNRALREFHRLKRGCLVEWERDVGIMDLGGASPTVTGELRANVWARERGSGKESEGEGEGGRQGGSEGVSEKGVEGGSGSVSGGGKEGGTVKGGARKGIRVQGDYVVDVTEMKERAGLERGFLVVWSYCSWV
ncbi:unnamed protein product [Closterium sp. NIES-64]|nr:unnamed protein product [Closterium sp. NIES-64]